MSLRRLAPLVFTLSSILTCRFTPDSTRHSTPGPRSVRPRAPEGQRRNALAFVRTELFFGSAKPDGAVTGEEFKTFLDEVVTPLFSDGLTVVQTHGQFRGADGVTIKEGSYVLILLYPLEGQNDSRNIDTIRKEYMRQHRRNRSAGRRSVPRLGLVLTRAREHTMHLRLSMPLSPWRRRCRRRDRRSHGSR